MTSFGYRLNPRYAIKECSSCGALYTRDSYCSKGNVEDKILVPKLPKNYVRCVRCGYLVDGPYCQGCALLRKKLEEDLVTYFQDFQNTFESSNDSTNVVNAPREPFVVKKDHGVNSSQNPSHIDECCCECGATLDEIFCQQCTCKSCGKGAYIGYNCPPKVPIISNPEPCIKPWIMSPHKLCQILIQRAIPKKKIQYLAFQNLTLLMNLLTFSTHLYNLLFILMNFAGAMLNMVTTVHLKFRLSIRSRDTIKTLISSKIFMIFNNSISFVISVGARTRLFNFLVIHPPPQETSIKILHDQENAIISVQTFLRKFNRYSFLETPKVLLLAWDRVFEIKDAFGTKQYKQEDIQEFFRKLFNDVQNIHEELAEYINITGWNRPAFYNDDDDDDDVDYTIAITPVLSTKDPDISLSMGDEHLDTISATESNEVIKSSVEDLVRIPSESEGIPNTMFDVHLVNNPTPLEAKNHFEIVINSNDDYSSSDDDYLYNENIEYVEASPHDSELVSFEVAEIVIPEDKESEDDNLREKLLNVNLLIAKIEALKDNPTPSFEFLTKSSSTSPKSFLEETNTFHNSLPEFKIFCFDLEEISSGSTTTHSDISLPDYEAFYFYDDHIEDISSGSTTTHYDISLSEYDSFIFDLSNDQFPPTDRSDFTHEEFANKLAHIISPP
nr:hypothetical protein [Tanacetum cinerariifolium]